MLHIRENAVLQILTLISSDLLGDCFEGVSVAPPPFFGAGVEGAGVVEAGVTGGVEVPLLVPPFFFFFLS